MITFLIFDRNIVSKWNFYVNFKLAKKGEIKVKELSNLVSSIVSKSQIIVFSSSPAVATFVPSGDQRQTRTAVPEFTKDVRTCVPVWNYFSNSSIYTFSKQGSSEAAKAMKNVLYLLQYTK